MATIDPRRLLRLAKAARDAGITRLKLPDGTEFELGAPREAAEAPPAFEAPPAVRPDVGSLAAMRKRFARSA